MIQGNTSGNKIKENKYKILRMSLLLGNGEDREETINNFEDAARDIDSMNDEIYLKDLEDKFYDTLTLEEEEKKLAVLVDYIGGRVEQRLSLLSDFSNVTGFELTSLAPVKYYDRLDEYKERLSYIRDYLDNTKRIKNLKEEISQIENKLNDTYVKKARSEEKNAHDEADILERFNKIIAKIDIFKDVTIDNVSDKLGEVVNLVIDSKKSLDIFDKSFATLNSAGISEEEEAEYLSYVNGAKEVYYGNKEDEYLLRLYMLFNTTETEYSRILAKRESINEIIYERLDLRRELNVSGIDNLSSIYDLLEKQYDDIKSQKNIIDDIDELTNDINTRKEQVQELETDNQRVEILSLLKEFCIIDTYDDVNVSSDEKKEEVEDNEVSIEEDVSAIEENNDTLEDSLNIFGDNNIFSEPVKMKEQEEVKEEVATNQEVCVDIENAKDNQVVLVKDATKINLDDAITKSSSVMKRVGEMLGVKTEDSKIVSVDQEKEEEKIEEPEAKEEVVNKEEENDNFIDSNVNIFTNTTFDADPESKMDFGNNNQDMNINPLFSNTLGNSTIDDVMAKNKEEMANDSGDNNDFWVTGEDSPLDLNSLPDFGSNDNSFFDTNSNNNGMPELNFPDLDISFDDMEGK